MRSIKRKKSSETTKAFLFDIKHKKQLIVGSRELQEAGCKYGNCIRVALFKNGYLDEKDNVIKDFEIDEAYDVIAKYANSASQRALLVKQKEVQYSKVEVTKEINFQDETEEPFRMDKKYKMYSYSDCVEALRAEGYKVTCEKTILETL